MPPKSILKHKSSAHAGPSSARGGKGGSGSGNGKSNGNGNGRDIERNTRINAGSKFQKSLQVERAGGPNGGGGNGRGKGRSSAGKASQKAPVQGRRGKDGDVNEDYVSDEGESSDGFGGVDGDGDEEMSDGSADTDEEIARGLGGGEKKKSTKRKRAATTAETFGSTLTSLLAESTTKPKKAKKTPAAEEEDNGEEEQSAKKAKATAPAAASATSAILSLSHARPPPSRSAENLERKAKKHLQVLKEEKEDRARVRDVVEGWAAKPIGVNGEVVGGQEFEKGLRKTAQRGVIKLFNAILIAAKNAEAATTSLSAKAGVKDESWKGGKREKDNIMGRGGKEAGLTQESFLDLVRKG